MIDVPRENSSDRALSGNVGHPSGGENATELPPELLAALPPEVAALCSPNAAQAEAAAAAFLAKAEAKATPQQEPTAEPAPLSPAAAKMLAPFADDVVPRSVTPPEPVEPDDAGTPHDPDPLCQLSSKQQHVLLGLCVGMPMDQLCADFKVHRRTIQRWKHQNPLFQRALRRMQTELRDETAAQLRSIADVAVAAVHRAMKRGDGRLAFQVLTQLGMADRLNYEEPRLPAEPPAPRAAPARNRITGRG
jgi:hypothetical protein